MNALQLLKKDHQDVSDLLDRFEREEGEQQKVELADRICRMLTVHAQIEEEIFYPAARAALGPDRTGLLDEAAVEHASVQDLIDEIEPAEPDDPMFQARLTVLGEYVRHHVKEEENELFPQLDRGDLDLDALGERLAQRKQALQAEAQEEAEVTGAGEDYEDSDELAFEAEEVTAEEVDEDDALEAQEDSGESDEAGAGERSEKDSARSGRRTPARRQQTSNQPGRTRPH